MKTKKIAKQALAAARCAQSVADSAYMQLTGQSQLQMRISEEVAKLKSRLEKLENKKMDWMSFVLIIYMLIGSTAGVVYLIERAG